MYRIMYQRNPRLLFMEIMRKNSLKIQSRYGQISIVLEMINNQL